MAHFCGFIKLIFLLLMLARMLAVGETRPQKGRTTASSDLIAGNEFLKLFMGHEELERELYNRRQVDGSEGEGNAEEFKDREEFDKKSAETGRTGSRLDNSRSLKIQGPKGNQAEGQSEDSKHEVVAAKVNSGSKVAFLEDYDENDAILDAEAREIDLKREKYRNKDDYKVVASSSSASSSSSQRGSTTTTAKNQRMTATTSKYDNKSYTSTQAVVTVTARPPTATTNKPSSSTRSNTATASASASSTAAVAALTTGDNFINRSHKSEFSVEEVQPSAAKRHHQLLQQQRKPQAHKARKQYTRHRTYPITSVADTLEALDSENSASTNVQNVLASPLQTSASLRSTSTVTTTSYHSGQRNVSINHDMSSSRKTNSGDISKDIDQQQSATGVDDQLLPFQTVIYHDTKGGHGPQSRSISYSSISQNVEDLKKWHQSGILAEARRNVSESLKPLPPVHQSEPAKFYSQPSKMYSEPSKFYSEPAKVYSEPSKIYGEPEKFYSEPAKVYGQPSKFYGEPSKVYSQPSKMYGEPAKTYWPVTLTTTTTTSGPASTSAPTTNPPQFTTTIAPPLMYPASRKPAIVSRIAFGEAHSSSSTSTTTSTTPATTTTRATTTTATTTTTTTTTTTGKPFFGSYQHNHQRTYGHRQPPSAASSENAASPPPSRRILFNLDRLPYDLLNAPQPATQQPLLELPKPQQQQQQTLTYQQLQPQPHQQRHHNINPCLDSAVSSLFSSSTLSAHPALIKQRQQHSSLSDQQHSNQNAKGLPNEDLVRCVAEISTVATISPSNGGADDGGGAHFTTERSNIEDLFTPTPEQNYEMEESVSAMTNGRAHGVQGGGRNSLALPTTPPPPFKPSRQRVHFGTNFDSGGDAVTGSSGGGHLSQSFNTNANTNGDAHSNSHQAHRNLHVAEGNTSPDYNSYDDDGSENDDNANDDYTDDDAGRHRGSAASNGGNGDDSKVAYVVEGRNYRKYRVEEKTDDGFIVGEYGVVDHNDGNLRGVRYTADSTINRSLIQKALLTFLKLK